MENNEENIETKNENQIKEQNEAKASDVQTNLENKIIKEDEIKNENEIKNETKEEHIAKDKENKDDSDKKETDIKESKDKETNDDAIDPHLIFQKELLRIIKKQQQILNSTSTINEKFGILRFIKELNMYKNKCQNKIVIISFLKKCKISYLIASKFLFHDHSNKK